MPKRIVVTGAGGFIGSHLVRRLKQDGDNYVVGVDLKQPEFSHSAADEFRIADLRHSRSVLEVFRDTDEVYALAADMGGMGYISNHHATILRNNLLISIHTLEAARRMNVGRYLFSSSACVYPVKRQTSLDVVGLKESEAYPADPEDAYGWEKLTTERLLTHYRNDYAMQVRIARFHNIYGPEGTWVGGREKAPAALCRKVAEAKLAGEKSIDIWGDGQQVRSFCYIDDCVNGLLALMSSDYSDPVNIGDDCAISIDGLARLICQQTNYWPIVLNYVKGPQGVRGRNSDNTLAESVLGFRPKVGLHDGLRKTYQWIEQQVVSTRTVPA